MSAEPQLLLDDLVFAEGPRWHEDRLWFSDMHAHEVVAVDEHGKRTTIAKIPGSPSGLGWLPDGRLLVVSMQDRRLLRMDDGRLVEHADLSSLAPFHLNDMVVDARGNAFVGNFGFDLHGGEKTRPTCLIHVSPDGRARVAAEELGFPNGSVITPDGGTLIVAESFAQRLTAFHVAADGTLSDRRVWAKLDFVPDGIALDADGCVWAADPVTPGSFRRVAPDGAVRQQIDAGGRGAFACA
ncbi:SMP-30/gluconolactonase/LRE family protein, partial [Candidatus Binatia bacterium]|nr:SMP-30/gluconolactonase/LRE family protein [Candidatus Binatia bacterium]